MNYLVISGIDQETYLPVSMGQESRHGLAGSSIQSFSRPKSRCRSGLQSYLRLRVLSQVLWLVPEFASSWLWDQGPQFLGPVRHSLVVCFYKADRRASLLL